jgi:hypothetical protein
MIDVRAYAAMALCWKFDQCDVLVIKSTDFVFTILI